MSKVISKIVVPDSSKLTGYALYNVKDANAIPASEKGAASGVATLDNTGKIPSSQIPSGIISLLSDWNQTDSTAGDYIKNKPTSMPASDVSSWAKKSTKPSYTKSEVGLGNVGNFLAVSTEASQGLSETLKTNARSNIGAGTSSFSGSYNDLIDKPTIPSVGNAEVEIQKNGTKVGSFTTNLSGSKVTMNITVPTGTAANKDVPTSGNASTSQVVMGNDSRLTDSRNAKDVYSWAKASSKPTYTASEVGAISTSAKGAANGVAQLDSTGKVPSSQLPSYVDDVLEYESKPSFPATGETGKIYIDKATNLTWRWGGSNYIEISPSLALGETSSTAYAGDKGKALADKLATIASGAEVNVQSDWNATSGDAFIKNKPTIPAAVTESTVSGWGFTKNAGTITGIKMNGSSKGTSGTVDLGTVITSHQNISGKVDKTTTVNGHALSSNVSVTKSDVGLGNVGNFKAVSTVASQGLTDTEKSNARANIGAGTSSFSGSYNDLSNKPTIPAAAANGTYTVKTLVGSTTTNVSDFTANQSSADDVTFVQGSNVTITPDAANRKITIAATDTKYTAATAAPGKVASSSAQGSSTNYARQDHTHGIDLATGDSNGQVKIAGTNVSVKGLGSAAYTASSAYATSQQLASDANLNNIKTVGFYNAGGGNSITNKPSGVEHFGMEVVHYAAGDYYVQIVYNNSNSWRRRCDNGTWGSWVQDKLTDTTYSAATTSAAGLMSAADKTKLNGIATGATANIGTVTQVKVGTTAYNPSSGVVTLPAYPTTLPASDVSAWAKAASKPSYTHNEIGAGDLTIGDGANSIYLRTSDSWATAIYHNTSADEAVVFLNKGINVGSTANYTTSWIFAYGNPSERPAWTSLIPALQIKGQTVAINKLIGSKVGGSYNLDVNGSANATTLYEKGKRVITSDNIGSQSVSYATSSGSATKLSTARTIWGQSFDGTGNVSGNATLTSINGVTVGSSPKFTDTTYSSKTAASGGTAVSLCTTGEKYTWNNKQAALVSGTNIKTINGTSILGSGNIEIQGGGGGEVITISLTQNAGSASDLKGATIVVKDNTENVNLLSTTWNGTAIEFEVPVPVNYTVTVGSRSGYQTPSAVTYNSRTGRSRNLTFQYKTEVVTVTVNTNKSGVTAQGQTVTINGVNTTVPASGTVTQKVPFGTTYSVSVNKKSGYATPANKSFTANTTSRSVTMTYIQRDSGVYILDTNNELFTTSEWSSLSHGTAVGVAVLSSAHNFVVSKDGNLMAPINNSDYQPCSGATAITNETTARQRYSGKADTALMVTAYPSTSDTIQYRCSNKTFANGKKGYLPSLGEMAMIINNITEINSCITAVGGTKIGTSCTFWTSTYYGLWNSRYYNFWSLSSTNAANYNSNSTTQIYGIPCCEY